ncbi:hypothetical protein [Nocardia otitidiscaviarum]|uniref:hypothetical protein n=1 Tax=Nocardia otitidiscaviarum TaxID=1823 RepID=UPI000A435EA3|nr:hypothetical protein [Nocardia otitidiscaviarum]
MPNDPDDEEIPLNELYLPDGRLNPEYIQIVPPSDDDIAMLLERYGDDSPH